MSARRDAAAGSVAGWEATMAHASGKVMAVPPEDRDDLLARYLAIDVVVCRAAALMRGSFTGAREAERLLAAPVIRLPEADLSLVGLRPQAPRLATVGEAFAAMDARYRLLTGLPQETVAPPPGAGRPASNHVRPAAGRVSGGRAAHFENAVGLAVVLTWLASATAIVTAFFDYAAQAQAEAAARVVRSGQVVATANHLWQADHGGAVPTVDEAVDGGYLLAKPPEDWAITDSGGVTTEVPHGTCAAVAGLRAKGISCVDGKLTVP